MSEQNSREEQPLISHTAPERAHELLKDRNQLSVWHEEQHPLGPNDLPPTKEDRINALQISLSKNMPDSLEQKLVEAHWQSVEIDWQWLVEKSGIPSSTPIEKIVGGSLAHNINNNIAPLIMFVLCARSMGTVSPQQASEWQTVISILKVNFFLLAQKRDGEVVDEAPTNASQFLQKLRLEAQKWQEKLEEKMEICLGNQTPPIKTKGNLFQEWYGHACGLLAEINLPDQDKSASLKKLKVLQNVWTNLGNLAQKGTVPPIQTYSGSIVFNLAVPPQRTLSDNT